MTLLHKLTKDKLIHPPKWLPDNTLYLCYMGSAAYGCSNDTSDLDMYGFAMPPREMVFPHMAGHVPGFGPNPQGFDVWSEHHIVDKSAGKEYDFSVYSIVKFFDLVRDNNPNMVDALFVPERCIVHSTDVSDMVRERRKEFLHKGAFSRFRGYAYQQLKKIEGKSNSSNPKRQASIEQFGYDVKFAYHIVRLALECEQILTTGDLDLECNSEILKAIRRGDWTLERLKEWFFAKEIQLEEAKSKSQLPEKPDIEVLRQLLLDCLEHHYGSLEKAVVRDVSVEVLKQRLQAVLDSV